MGKKLPRPLPRQFAAVQKIMKKRHGRSCYVTGFFASGTSDAFVSCFVAGVSLALLEYSSLADFWRCDACVAGSNFFPLKKTISLLYFGFFAVSPLLFAAGTTLAFLFCRWLLATKCF